MKLMHLSDLHIGKRVNGYSMLEDQKDILEKILKIVDDEKPDGILIAGDIYDKTVPSAEAVEMLDGFIVSLAQREIETFIISGNHDSAERLAFGNRLMNEKGVHFSSVYDGNHEKFTLSDEYGDVVIHMLPFIKPANVRSIFEGEIIESYTDAMRVAIAHMEVNPSDRNVLITHQFVTGATRSESEEKSIGGTDNVDASLFDGFDYVALGHIHGPQNIGGNNRIRYSGTPLKYSFSEKDHKKSVTIVELGGNKSIDIKTIPLVPKRDWVEIRGKYDDITLRSFYKDTTWTEDYTRIILEDEEDVTDAFSKLNLIYKNIMSLDYDNTRTRTVSEITDIENVEHKDPLELFADFYKMQNGSEMSDEQESIVKELVSEIWGDER